MGISLKYRQRSYADGWKFEIGEDGTAYLQVSNFVVWKLSFKYKDFLAKAFSEIKAKITGA